jgi:S1-C subfamily serine protease
VGEVYAGGASDGYLKSGDVILSIDGLPVSSDGTVPMDGDQVEMAEVVERKFKGDTVAFDVIRDRKPVSVKVPLDRPWPFAMQANAYDKKPRYLIYGGLVFQPLDANFINEYSPENLRLRYYYDHFISQALHLKKPEIVVLSNVLADPVNAYAAEFTQGIVEAVNGTPIKGLDDLAKAIDAGGEYVVIEFLGPGRPLVLERKAAEIASPQILSRYGIQKDRNLVP